MKKKITYLLLSCHFLVLIIFNVSGIIDSTKSYYYKNDYEPDLIVKAFRNLNENVLFDIYSVYTGLNSSYGFYAPNVASQFIVKYSFYDSDGLLLKSQIRPKFKHLESNHRFDLYTIILQNKMGLSEENELLNDYFKVILSQVKDKIAEDLPTYDRTIVAVYLYQYPTINEFRNQKKHSLLFVEQHVFYEN